ncbi:Phage Tail Collar Domain protein [Photorhabdus australis subsp. thailandensis]|uniref:Phage Tail Collar Domain protein n=1 Tax=Photorhabdus australis subsp. thailandensis TaxID=2805096 RepID=A0A1C0U9H7_9GAMM|nr:phage tail protein [Photorhabdus australis]OCQ54577.1 Phage Tail Collar Domain protein [Photorhabdus australis subsp. thailandensis]
MNHKNDFKAFSISNDASIISQEKYEESQSLQAGFPPENISIPVLNKELRQSSTIASVVANFIKEQSGDDVLDDGDITKLTEQLNRALEQKISDISNIPVGVPVPWPTTIPPAGWLQCNGSVFDQSKFPKLAEAYPDGKLPDLRGEFIRGWDDGRGIDKNRRILTHQGDAIRNIQGSFASTIAPNYHLATRGAFYASQVVGIATDGSFKSVNNFNPDTPYGFGFEASRVVPVASENRPSNVAFNYIVRAA